MYWWFLGMGLEIIGALPGISPSILQCGHLWYGTETLHSRSMDLLQCSAHVIVDALTCCLSLSVVSCGCMICSMCAFCANDHIMFQWFDLRCCWMTICLRVDKLFVMWHALVWDGACISCLYTIYSSSVSTSYALQV